MPPSIPACRQRGSRLHKGSGGSGGSFFFRFGRNSGISVTIVGLGFSGSRMQGSKPLLHLFWDGKGLSEPDWLLGEQERSFCYPITPFPCLPRTQRKRSGPGHDPAPGPQADTVTHTPQPLVWDPPSLSVSAPPGKKTSGRHYLGFGRSGKDIKSSSQVRRAAKHVTRLSSHHSLHGRAVQKPIPPCGRRRHRGSLTQDTQKGQDRTGSHAQVCLVPESTPLP